jgi:hypothetical protein
LCKNEDPDAWVTTLEELRIKAQDMGSKIKDDQFMIHVLNNLTSDHELHMVLLEKRIGNEENSLEVKKLREELNLQHERLSIQSESSHEKKANEEKLKSKFHICGVFGHKPIPYKARKNHGNRQSDVNAQPPSCAHCRKTGHVKANCFILNKKMTIMM